MSCCHFCTKQCCEAHQHELCLGWCLQLYFECMTNTVLDHLLEKGIFWQLHRFWGKQKALRKFMNSIAPLQTAQPLTSPVALLVRNDVILTGLLMGDCWWLCSLGLCRIRLLCVGLFIALICAPRCCLCTYTRFVVCCVSISIAFYIICIYSSCYVILLNASVPFSRWYTK